MLSQNNKTPVIPNTGDTGVMKNLIEKAKQGDATSFEVIYTQLYSPLYRYIYSRTKNKDLSDDIIQQVFLRFYQALPRYEHKEGEGSLLAYLFTIGKRLIINEGVRKKTIPLSDEDFENIKDEKENLFDEADIKILSEKIGEFLPMLTDDEEDVIRLFYFSELSHKEISFVLEKEEAYIRKIKERALRKLRHLTKHLYENH